MRVFKKGLGHHVKVRRDIVMCLEVVHESLYGDLFG